MREPFLFSHSSLEFTVPVYAYKAHDATDRVLAGTLVADTPADGRARLRERDLRIVQFRPASVRERPGPRFGRSSARRREQVSGGSTLAYALERHPATFYRLVISAVRVGQSAGSLDEALTELSAFLLERQTLHARLTGALVYPCVLLGLGIGVVVFLMSTVIPQLLAVLIASGKPLPASTVLLKSFSDALLEYGWLMLGGGVLLGAGVGAFVRTERGRLLWHRMALRLPLLGPLLAKTSVAQFAQMTTMLLRSGVPFVDAIDTVARSVHNRVLRAELIAIKAAVEAGSDVAPTLEGSRIFPPLVQHLVAVGQDTGELAAMLGQLRTGYETEVRLAVSRFTAALEPLLIVILAVAIGFVVFATMMPILEASRVMN